MPPEDLPAVARRLADAVLRHAQAVADNDPDQRITAGPALTAALEAYGIAVVNAGSEPVDGVEDFDEWLDEEDGIHHEEDPPDHRERFGIFVRADVAVRDWPLLRAEATKAVQQCTGDESAQVMDAAEALQSYFGIDPVLDDARMDAIGVETLFETSVVVRGVVEPELPLDDFWKPLDSIRGDEEAG